MQTKTILGALFALVFTLSLIFSASPVSAQGKDVAGQIAALFAQIKELQAQIVRLQTYQSETSCNTFSDLRYGNFDDTQNGRVSQLQTWLGIPSSTFGFGTYGRKTQDAWYVMCGTAYATATTTYTVPSQIGNTPPSLDYSLRIIAGRSGASLYNEGSNIDGLVLTVVNNSPRIQTLTFPTSCRYTYTITNESKNVVFDLGATQNCVPNINSITLNSGHEYSFPVEHQDRHFHLKPGKYAITATVKDSYGTATAQTYVDVKSAEPTCTLSANPYSPMVGEYITLSWSSKNAIRFIWKQSGTANLLGLPYTTPSNSGTQSFKVAGSGDQLVVTLLVYAENGDVGSCITILSVDPSNTTIETDQTSTVSPTTPPTINSINPSQGGANTIVTIYGANLSGASTVEFYNNDVHTGGLGGASIISSNSTSVTFKISGIFAANSVDGSYRLKVVTPYGTSNGSSFTLRSQTTP